MRFVVPRKGFEPSPPNKQGQGSKPCASANSATSALRCAVSFNCKLKFVNCPAAGGVPLRPEKLGNYLPNSLLFSISFSRSSLR